jgi:hypothetical protein
MGVRLSIRMCLAGALLVALMGGRVAAAPGFTFAIVGDRTDDAVEGVYEQVLGDIAFLGPDLFVTVGDQIQGYLADSAAVEDEWDRVTSLLDGTGIPYHLTAGNHDIWGDLSRRIYSRRFGSPDTSFVFRNNLFVILDVSTYYRAADLPAAKIKWLEKCLSNSGRYANTFVFYHKPFWCEDFSFGRPDLLHDIFRRHGVDAVFTGHYHRSFYTERDGIRYFGVSSSGGSLPPGGRDKGCFHSYLLARVEGPDVEVRLLEPGLGESPQAITMEEMIAMEQMESDAVHIEGVETSGCSLVGTAKVTIGIHNQGTSTLRDTACWKLAGDWTIEPSCDYIEVPPGETGTMTAYAGNTGRLFPVPELTVTLASGPDKVSEVSRPLPVRRLIYAARCDSAPVVDGVLEKVWRHVDRETCFFGSVPDVSPGDSTALRICHDRGSVYVAVECFGGADDLAAGAETRDAFGGYDDYVLLLFQPDPGSDTYFQMAVNPSGTVFDKRVEVCPFGTYVQDPGWDAPVEVATLTSGDGWTAEMRIPVSSLGHGAEEATRWGFNFRRMHRRLDASSDFQIPLAYASDRLGVLVLQ